MLPYQMHHAQMLCIVFNTIISYEKLAILEIHRSVPRAV